jgi:hypothetical protein
VLEALEEHHVVKWTLSELDGMSADDERFGAKMAVLMEMVSHHVKEEETELFPKVRAAISRPELVEMGRMLTSAKATASKRPHPRNPDQPTGNLVAAAVNAPMDMLRSAGEATARTMRKLANG